MRHERAPGSGIVESRRNGRRPLPASAAPVLAFVVGSLPFSWVTALMARGVDLRTVGSGTVSGTGLYQVAGFPALAVAGTLDLVKGALGTAVVDDQTRGGWSRVRCVDRRRALAAGLTIAGHNWSPFLGGAGGRGLAPALGATLVLSPEATLVLALGLGGGRLVRHTGAGCFWAILALMPVLAATRGWNGVVEAAAVATPLLAKRVLGNGAPERADLATLLNRLVLDRDPVGAAAS